MKFFVYIFTFLGFNISIFRIVLLIWFIGILIQTYRYIRENRAFKRYIEDGQDLPQGVFRYRNSDGKNSDSEFYTVYEPDLTEREINEFLTMKKLQILKSIKSTIAVFGSVISGFLLVFLVLLLAGR